MIDHEQLAAIVRAAGDLAMASWPGGMPDGTAAPLRVWEKAPGNPVCAGDLAVDGFLKQELRALLPGAGWLSEETADDRERLRGDLLWVVDPIDGTRDYIAGRTGWAVSVALVSGGRPVLGTLCAPARCEFWHAQAGKGAWRNGVALTASRRTRLAGARVPARSLPPDDADLVLVAQPNGIALRIAMIAADEADLVATRRWGYEWDIAAATLIAGEAGAIVTDSLGAPLTFNKSDPRAFGVLASAPAIHPPALARLAGRRGHPG